MQETNGLNFYSDCRPASDNFLVASQSKKKLNQTSKEKNSVTLRVVYYHWLVMVMVARPSDGMTHL